MYAPPIPPPVKKGHRLRNWLIGIGVSIVAVIAGVAGCAALVGSVANHVANPNSVSGPPTTDNSPPASTVSTPPPSGPVELRLGDSASISQNGTDAATIVVGRLATSTQPVDSFSDGPQNGYFVEVHVTATGAAGLTNGFDINPLDFYALSGTTHYDEGDGNAFEAPHSSAELQATTINAGETATGWLLFDLPSPHGKIVYAPNLDGQPLAYWTF